MRRTALSILFHQWVWWDYGFCRQELHRDWRITAQTLCLLLRNQNLVQRQVFPCTGGGGTLRCSVCFTALSQSFSLCQGRLYFTRRPVSSLLTPPDKQCPRTVFSSARMQNFYWTTHSLLSSASRGITKSCHLHKSIGQRFLRAQSVLCVLRAALPLSRLSWGSLVHGVKHVEQ